MVTVKAEQPGSAVPLERIRWTKGCDTAGGTNVGGWGHPGSGS